MKGRGREVKERDYFDEDYMVFIYGTVFAMQATAHSVLAGMSPTMNSTKTPRAMGGTAQLQYTMNLIFELSQKPWTIPSIHSLDCVVWN